jgi:glycosyltransferase involved in cell wall biosynthesis
LRIVLAAHHYPPTFVAGVELLTKRLATWMADHGHAVDVVCIDDIDAPTPFMVRTELDGKVRIHRLGLQLTGQKDALGMRHRDEALRLWFADFLRVAQPDVFHSQSSYLLTTSLIEAAKDANVPVVASLHDYWYLCPRITLLRSDGTRCDSRVTPSDCARCLMGEKRRNRLIQTVDRSAPIGFLNHRLVERVADRQEHLDTVLRSVDQVVTPALLTRELLLARGFSPEHVRLVRQGIERPPARIRPPNQPGRLRIGYMGQFVEHKGVHVLIEAFRHLKAGARTPELVLHGDMDRFPRYSASLRKSVAGLPGVRFAGTYSNDHVWSVVSDLDVLVVPSMWYEISPLVILEALAAGVPVIASDLRNMNYQICDGQDGLLFAPGDHHDLRSKLQRLIDEPDLLTTLRAGIRPTHEVNAEMLEIQGVYASLARGRDSEISSSASPVSAAH